MRPMIFWPIGWMAVSLGRRCVHWDRLVDFLYSLTRRHAVVFHWYLMHHEIQWLSCPVQTIFVRFHKESDAFLVIFVNVSDTFVLITDERLPIDNMSWVGPCLWPQLSLFARRCSQMSVGFHRSPVSPEWRPLCRYSPFAMQRSPCCPKYLSDKCRRILSMHFQG